MVEMLKQPDGHYSQGYAGDTYNMAHYLAYLSAEDDIHVSYVTALGQDKFSRQMIDAWRKNNIDTQFVMTTDKKNAGLYFADTDENGHRNYLFYRNDSAAKQMFQLPEAQQVFSELLSYDVLYASAVTLMILSESDRQKLIDLFAAAKAKGITTAFDTNYRKAGWASSDEAAQWMNRILPYVTIAMPTHDENKEVFKDANPVATMNRLKALNIPEIVVKCGELPCLIYADGKEDSVPAISNINAIDTTGAGDSFNAGYLYGRLKGMTANDAASIGHRLAAQIVQHRGAIIPNEKIAI